MSKVKHSDDEDLSYLVSAVMKYSRYSWSTWFVLKIFIKLTTYSMLKARDMEEEAHKWITDWGPIVNPFIDYVFLPVSRIVIFFLDDDYYFFNGPLYNCYIKDLVEPPFYIIQDISVKILICTCPFMKHLFALI